MYAAGASTGAASAALPSDSAAFKGVLCTSGRFHAHAFVDGKLVQLGAYATALEAACAYDDANRKLGSRVVNFPRAGTNEVQAVKGEHGHKTLLRADGKLRSGPLPQASNLKGVQITGSCISTAPYRAQIGVGGKMTDLGAFCTELEAARAYDDAARKAGRRVVNFPRPGSDEVQAVRGEVDRTTLRRHADQQTQVTTGGAGGGYTILQPAPKVGSPAATVGTAALASPFAGFANSSRVAAAAPPPIRPPPVSKPAVAPPAAKKPRLDERAPASVGVQTPAAAVKPKVPAAQHAPDSAKAAPSAPPAPSAAAAAAPVKTETEVAVAAFLRGVSPPLIDLSIALKACAGSGLSMAHLRRVANSQPAHSESAVSMLAASLGLRRAGDRISLMLALHALADDGARV